MHQVVADFRPCKLDLRAEDVRDMIHDVLENLFYRATVADRIRITNSRFMRSVRIDVWSLFHVVPFSPDALQLLRLIALPSRNPNAAAERRAWAGYRRQTLITSSRMSAKSCSRKYVAVASMPSAKRCAAFTARGPPGMRAAFSCTVDAARSNPAAAFSRCWSAVSDAVFVH